MTRSWDTRIGISRGAETHTSVSELRNCSAEVSTPRQKQYDDLGWHALPPPLRELPRATCIVISDWLKGASNDLLENTHLSCPMIKKLKPARRFAWPEFIGTRLSRETSRNHASSGASSARLPGGGFLRRCTPLFRILLTKFQSGAIHTGNSLSAR